MRVGYLMTAGSRGALLGIVSLVAACASTGTGDAHHAAGEREAQLQTAPPTPGQGINPAEEQKFHDFLHDFRATAIAAGISAEHYDLATQDLVPNARVEELNAEQPEFTIPAWTYLDNMVSDKRIADGDQRLAQQASSLEPVTAKFGVPAEILVAIWGAESDYGQAMGSFNMFEALATLAYDGPRADYARKEFLAALQMMEKENYRPQTMTSSWAGAFGQTQFVPSSFLAHAVDGDGDGKIDLWNDPADALASAAALLADAGWERGNVCDYEVSLPAGFDYALADVQNAQDIETWRKLGVKQADGRDLPDSAGPAAIYLPAGAHGPAFMVFDNFKVVLKYNNADSYALAICTLAARFKGAGLVMHPWPRDELPLQPDERIAFQESLKTLGFDPGPLDGVLGHGVRAALRAYQKARGLDADGFPTHALLTRMMSEAAAVKH
jgi:membrane-bound lytic murein transglycosylase B